MGTPAGNHGPESPAEFGDRYFTNQNSEDRGFQSQLVDFQAAFFGSINAFAAKRQKDHKTDNDQDITLGPMLLIAMTIWVGAGRALPKSANIFSNAGMTKTRMTAMTIKAIPTNCRRVGHGTFDFFP